MSAGVVPFRAAPFGVEVQGMQGGSGPPALLLHGTAGSWRNFEPWLPALLPRAALVIPDLPGFGASPAPSVRPRLRTWARLLHALVAELGAPPRILVGLGLGASVALAYLQVAPPAAVAALSHLVLYTPAYYPGAIRPTFRWGVRVVGAAPVFAVVRWLLSRPDVLDWYVRHVVQGPDTPPEDARLLAEDFRRASLPVLRGLARELVRADFRPLLATLPTPTLVLAGRHDPFVYPAAMERLAALMPHAQVVVQDLGHGWTPEAVGEQQRLLAAFLDAPRAATTDPYHP